MGNLVVDQENMNRIEEELDDALCDCYDAPMYIIVKTVLNILDIAEKENRLNIKERKLACDYLSECYGYNF